MTYLHLVSTIALPDLLRLLADAAPPAARAAVAGLRWTGMRCVNFGIGRAGLTDKHWIYFPEEEFVFHRVFARGNASPCCSPPGGFGLTCEISYSPTKPLLLFYLDRVDRAKDATLGWVVEARRRGVSPDAGQRAP